MCALPVGITYAHTAGFRRRFAAYELGDDKLHDLVPHQATFARSTIRRSRSS